MANIKSSKKRIQVGERNRLENQSKKTEIRSLIKKFEEVLEENQTEEAQELLKEIDKKIKRASLKGAMSKNAGRNTISRLQLKLNEALSSK